MADASSYVTFEQGERGFTAGIHSVSVRGAELVCGGRTHSRGGNFLNQTFMRCLIDSSSLPPAPCTNICSALKCEMSKAGEKCCLNTAEEGEEGADFSLASL